MGAPQQALLMIGGWSPSAISGLVLWLDAADTATITSSSNVVSQWNDKSSSAFHCTQTNSGQRPLTNTNSQNGRNVITFDGSDDCMGRTNATLFRNLTGWSMFTVAKTTTNSSANGQNIVTVLTPVPGAVTRAATTVRNGSPNNAELFNTARRLNADSATNLGLGGSAVGTAWFYSSFVGNFSTTTGTLYKNGTQIATSSSWSTSGNSSNDGGILGVGAFTDVSGGVTESAFWTGDIGEILLYNSALGTSDRQAVEAYLASKWGI